MERFFHVAVGKALAQVPANRLITSGGNRNPTRLDLEVPTDPRKHLATGRLSSAGLWRRRHDSTSVVIDCRHRSRPGRRAPPGRRTPRPRRALHTCADDHGSRRGLSLTSPTLTEYSPAGPLA